MTVKKYACIQVCKYICLQVLKYESVQVLKYASVPVCKCKVYKYASMKNASMWIWN